MITMTDRIENAVRELVRSGQLDEVQGAAVVRAVRAALAQPSAPSRRRWPEIVGYVGGVVTVAAVLLLVGRAWEDLGQGGRALVLGGAAVALAAAALVIRGRGALEAERRRLAGTLLSAAVVAGASVAAVLGGGRHGLLATGLTGLVLGATAYALVRSLVGQMVTLAAAVATATGVLASLEADATWAYGLAVAAVGAVWVVLAAYGPVAERVAGVTLGFAVLAAGTHLVAEDRATTVLGYVLSFLTAAAAVAVYLRARRWPVLAVGLAALLVVVFQVVSDVTGTSLAAVWVVLALGLVLLAASGWVLRRRA
jgi:hypothetical protein